MTTLTVLLLIFSLGECRGSLVLVAGSALDYLPGILECRNREEQVTDLVSAFDEIQSNTTIIICSKTVVLNLLISIVDVRDIAIVGSGAVIKCTNGNNSGFQVKNVSNFDIFNLHIRNCSHQVIVNISDDYHLRASISIVKSCDVSIQEVVVTDGPDSGLAMLNVDGLVNIYSCTFANNGQEMRNGGNGVYIEISSYLHLEPQSCSRITYVIHNCTLVNNTANTTLDDKVSGFSRFDKGGGLCVFIRGKSDVLFKIQNSTFHNNTSYKYGGGIYLSYHGSAAESSIVIENCSLTGNLAKHGGGLYNGYLHVREPTFTSPHSCSFTYEKVTIEHNTAEFGGGFSMYATKTSNINTNTVSFTDCQWRNNSAHFGSAVAILPNAWNVYTPGYLPMVILTSIVLFNNTIKPKTLDYRENSVIRQYSEGAGAVYCSSHTIQVFGYNNFSNNRGSCIYLESGILRFRKNSMSTFSHNEGYRGGAILLIGSLMYLHDNSTLVFDSNKAYEAGGAIYSSPIGSHMRYYSQTCFFDYSQDETRHPHVGDRNITVFFTNNVVQHSGKSSGLGYSIFVSSLRACSRRHKFSINSSFQLNETIGTFVFDPVDRDMEISTEVDFSKIEYSKNHAKYLLMLAGKEETISYEDIDDLDQQTATTYLVSILNDNNSSEVIIDGAYRYITTNKLMLYGRGGDKATVILSSIGVRKTEKWFHVELKMCPPGFVELQDSNNPIEIKCVCSANNRYQYKGITKCDNKEFKAMLSIGYWVGYDSDVKEDENSLLTGQCPVRFCAHINEWSLISSANKSELSNLVCAKSREGILCGSCKAGLKPHFHSPQLECKSSKYCYLGWLFYLITEILPVTVLFLLILIFNVPFTSGFLNGFIFYSQVVELFPTVPSDDNHLNIFSTVLRKIHYLIYMIFNLKPLEMNELSYCIHYSESALDIIAFNYVTLAYSFILLLCLLLIIKKYEVCCLRIFKRFIPNLNFEQGTVHGLTAFLILCYANCARTSFLLLLPENVYTKEEKLARSVVYYYGEIEWMGLKHLNYAIPAVFILISVCGLPPVFLLIYPAHFRLFSALKINESSATKVIMKPLDKLKPIFDSFQGCFKDHCRFFAGLYFIYRLLIILIVLLFRFQDVYFLLQMLLILMILLHAIFQPYKHSVHNTIDMLIFINLAIIHTITFYNFKSVNSDSRASNTVLIITGILQNILILVPAVLVIIYAIIKKSSCKKKVQRLISHNASAASEEIEFFEFETREHNENIYSANYIKEQ